jgi:ABC-type branched-subunit amino acid transport system ATPase component
VTISTERSAIPRGVTTESGAPWLLRTEKLSKTFGGFRAVADVSVGVREHEILGIIGPNGAGKTTLFNLIAGSQRPTSGKVYLRGADITSRPPHRRLQLGLARTFQLIRPFTSLTVYENVLTAGLGSGLRRRAAAERANEVVERLGLGPLVRKSAASINAVEGKRLELARALASAPSVLLLDEVFSGLGTEEVDEMVALVRQIRREGTTVLIIEHNVRAIGAAADRVLAIDSGQSVCDGPPERVFRNPTVMESYLGHRDPA